MHGTGNVVFGAKGVDGLNVFRGEGEVKALEVALDARGGQALGQDDVTASSVPIEQDLCGSLVVLGGNRIDGGILKLVTSGKGGVSLDLDTVGVAELDESLALAEGVDLDLIDGRNDGGVLNKTLDVRGTKVGDADGPYLAELLGGLEGAPGIKALLLILGRGVNQVQVEIVQTELLQRGAEGIEGGLVTVVSIPQLGADVDILTGSAGLLKPSADGTTASLLVGISGSRVNVAVAGIQSGGDGILSLLAVGGLVNTQGDLGDGVTVVQLDGGRADRGNGAAVGAGLGVVVEDGFLHRDLALRRSLGGDGRGSHFERWDVFVFERRGGVSRTRR